MSSHSHRAEKWSCYYSKVNAACQRSNSLVTPNTSVLRRDIFAPPACRQTASGRRAGETALGSVHDALWCIFLVSVPINIVHTWQWSICVSPALLTPLVGLTWHFWLSSAVICSIMSSLNRKQNRIEIQSWQNSRWKPKIINPRV